ncbi:hypothetical protein JVT61DRAFT_4246 [Boletus reticuloceps]|uniref:Uncharacterized protein n=1 Tax=Boletus reticuloceps TaxID=495285 RepID=A0A8I2YMC3_9AGAM|nr:hypothetical protein JVT61DRAFT_4246 [Boletus reticuloceps]
MASVWAYFQGRVSPKRNQHKSTDSFGVCSSQVAYKRFIDMVPMTIDHEIVLGMQKGIYRALQEGLQVTGPEGQDCCKSMLEECISVVTTRQET